MTLTSKAKQLLKAKAHKLKPIVFIGNKGLTNNVREEIERGLVDHELIKIGIQAADRQERESIFTDICEHALAQPIQLIGGIGTIYRKNMD